MATRGVNKVILIGRLGADPDVRYMANGDPVTNIRLATNQVWKDRQTGEQQERTEWHRVVFFRGLAGIAGEYLRKGSNVYIEGSIRTRKWQGQDGQDHYTTEIVADEMQMLDSRSGGTASFEDGGAAEFTEPAKAAPAATPTSAPAPAPAATPTPAPAPAKEKSGFDDFDDDIPF